MKYYLKNNVDANSVVWNPVLDSVLRLYQKLVDLGFTSYDGQLSVIDGEEEDPNA